MLEEVVWQLEYGDTLFIHELNGMNFVLKKK